VAVACVVAALAACGDTSDPAPAAQVPIATSARATATPSDDGCSSDNSPTNVVVTPGATPEIPVRQESADSPLPDLVVRRINCAGGWVNLRNEVPADTPVLVWFWAPY
jgi:hypothetical protein